MAARTVDESNEERKRELEEARRGIASAESRPLTLTPKVSQLMGALEGADVDETDYHAHLERKHL